MSSLVKLETLDTGFVNLGALLRHLRQLSFVGRVKVELDDYEADVFLQGAGEPTVWEKNLATGRGAEGQEAMDRLLVRARDPGGLITIFEGPDEKNNHEADDSHYHSAVDLVPEATLETAAGMDRLAEAQNEETDWDRLIAASGELIGGVERATESVNENFPARFRATLIAMGDDYPFLEPTGGSFEYHDGKVVLSDRPAASDFISSLAEALRRLISRIVDEKGGTRFRERVAVELAVVARRNENAFAEFTPHLDRIAGTRVL
ncbi:MAG TPA: hypothetical protein VNO50_03380 [Pyrinomonadaceae bacterium]|nr:hypothetical protein [Pyrinomonadaceae bacterium]